MNGKNKMYCWGDSKTYMYEECECDGDINFIINLDSHCHHNIP